MSITVEVKKVEKVKPEANGPIFVQKTIGADTWLVMAQSAVQLEDEFANLYYTVQNQSNIFLQPPYHPQELKNLCQSNNVLNQCIEAMEVNIDGTGHEFVASDTIQAELEEKKKALKEKQRMDDYKASVQNLKDTHQAATDNVNNLNATAPGEVPPQAAPPKPIIPPPPQESLGDGIDPEEKKQATAFFAEPYPGLSFISIRRKLRREIESVGYAYLEILRNLNGDLVGIRNIETHNVRMVKLDAPVLVTKTINRGGVDVEIQIWERQRRFAQRVALKQLVYYREYGTARQVNRNTGRWEIQGEKDKPDELVAPEDRGTELLIFGVHPDITTPYFVPRWINEVPSVVGSRKAEEQNLEFLDAGAMPPAIIFVQGGTLAKESADQLRMYLSGKNKAKHRAVVVEAQSSSGSLESAGSVQVKVERFGAERAMDAMFQNYDKGTEEHIRVGFRLPPLFLGKPADYNRATAVTAYMVAEEQVFQPERTEFDEKINMTIIKELGFKTLKFKSLPVILSNSDDQIKVMVQVKDRVTSESFIEEANKITGLGFEVADQPTADRVVEAISPGATLDAKPLPGKAGGGGGGFAGKRETTTRTASELMELAEEYAAIRGVKKRDMTEIRKAEVLAEIKQLPRKDFQMFNNLLTVYKFGESTPDLVNITKHVH